MAYWLVGLPAVFPQAFALLRTASAVNFQEERIDWRDFRQSELPVRHPAEFLSFVEFLLTHIQEMRVLIHGCPVKARTPSVPSVSVIFGRNGERCRTVLVTISGGTGIQPDGDGFGWTLRMKN